jgi:hypothetical protein
MTERHPGEAGNDHAVTQVARVLQSGLGGLYARELANQRPGPATGWASWKGPGPRPF